MGVCDHFNATQRINSLDRVNVREARAGEIDRKMARLIDRSIDL